MRPRPTRAASARLLDGAKARHDLRETRSAADKVRRAARSAEDEAARQARLHKSRSLRIGESPEGHVTIRGQFTPAAFAGVKPILDAHLKARVEQARRDGDPRRLGRLPGRRLPRRHRRRHPRLTPRPAPPRPAAVADALRPTATATAAAAARPMPAEGRLFAPGDEIAEADGLDPKVELEPGHPRRRHRPEAGLRGPGETCEIPGIGTIPVAWIEPLLPDIHTEMLIHDAVDIRAYATRTRHRTRPVDLAVRVRDRDCTVPRCHHDISELDHIADYADTHDTSVANVHGMCNANHDDKTYRHATFQRHDTNWQLVAPRHRPRHHPTHDRPHRHPPHPLEPRPPPRPPTHPDPGDPPTLDPVMGHPDERPPHPDRQTPPQRQPGTHPLPCQHPRRRATHATRTRRVRRAQRSGRSRTCGGRLAAVPADLDLGRRLDRAVHEGQGDRGRARRPGRRW